MSTSPPIPPNPPPSHDDDPVARAMDALRRVPVPDGPPPETVARTLAALRAADESPAAIPRIRTRRTLMFTLLKSAAAILAAAAAATYFAAFPPASARSEFAETAARLRDAQTLTLRHTQTLTLAGKTETMSSRMLYKVPGLVRIEPEIAGAPVSIMDSIGHRILVLNPADKSAMLMEQPAGAPAEKRDGAAMMIEDLRRLAGKDTEPVGEKLVGDIHARGFRVKEGGTDLTVWVDPQKKLPVLVEFTGRTGGIDFKGSFSDIRLDPALDDALFRLDPPEGYTLRKANVRMTMTFEEAVVRILRNYTNASGGRFPARLDDFNDYVKVVSAGAMKKAEALKAQGKDLKASLEPEALQSGIAGAMLAVNCQKYKDRYGYKPDGAKLGDANAIIFWYQPEGQEKSRVVYADLHIGEVTGERVPGR
ncbi:MAG: LolA family protein [Isosphaeraceae bacterium]